MIGKAGGGFEAPVMLLSEAESETQKINSFDLKDVNADGKADLIAVYRASNGRVLVAFGNGGGGFAAPASYAAGQFPGDSAIADFNSDGKPDIVLLGFNNTPPLSILLNNGDGTFGAAAPINTPGMFSTSGFRIGVGDFNQDGKVDLAILGQSSQFVVLLGDGAGKFTPQTPISTTFSGQSFAIDDFNADGKSDVVIAGDGIQLLEGRGDGGFNTPVNYPYGNSRTSIVAEDFNGDGGSTCP
jgi:FG-GAP-like repeat